MVKWLLFQLVFEELIAENKIIISTHEPRDVFVNEHTFLKSDFSCWRHWERGAFLCERHSNNVNWSNIDVYF